MNTPSQHRRATYALGFALIAIAACNPSSRSDVGDEERGEIVAADTDDIDSTPTPVVDASGNDIDGQLTHDVDDVDPSDTVARDISEHADADTDAEVVIDTSDAGDDNDLSNADGTADTDHAVDADDALDLNDGGATPDAEDANDDAREDVDIAVADAEEALDSSDGGGSSDANIPSDAEDANDDAREDVDTAVADAEDTEVDSTSCEADVEFASCRLCPSVVPQCVDGSWICDPDACCLAASCGLCGVSPDCTDGELRCVEPSPACQYAASPGPTENYGSPSEGVDRGPGNCVLVADGRVACWGHSYGWVPQWLDIAEAITSPFVVGVYEVCSATATGLLCQPHRERPPSSEGTRPAYETTLPAPVAEIAVSHDAFCALSTEGTVYCAGHGTDGVLGSRDAPDRATFTPIDLGATVTQIEAKAFGFCALTAEQQVYCWGHFSGSGNNGISDGALSVDLSAIGEERVSAFGVVSHRSRRARILEVLWILTESGQLWSGQLEPSFATSKHGTSPDDLPTVEGALGWEAIQQATNTERVDWFFGGLSVAFRDGSVGRAWPSWREPVETGGPEGFAEAFVARQSNGTRSWCGLSALGGIYCWGGYDGTLLGNGSLLGSEIPQRVRFDVLTH